MLVLLVAFIILQFFGIDTTNPTVIASEDFIHITQPDDDIKNMLKRACYDCHSNQTVYPWYAHITPVSWWIGHHIEEGREHLNFSKWGTFSKEKKNHKLHECEEEVEEGNMPLDSYTWTHGGADLSKAQKKKLAEWFEGQMNG